MKKIQFILFTLVAVFGVSNSFADRGLGVPEKCAVAFWSEQGEMAAQKMNFNYSKNSGDFYAKATFTEDFARGRFVYLTHLPNTYRFVYLQIRDAQTGTLVVDNLRVSRGTTTVVADPYEKSVNYTIKCN